MNLKTIVSSLICLVILLFVSSSAVAADLVTHAPKDAQAYIIEPANGATVPQTFSVKFGLSGMELAPAGIKQENTGHHHLLIDKQDLPDLMSSLPSTEQIRHFGKAQTEAEITLEPGEHSLQLVLGNYLHIPHDNPVISQPVTVQVK